MPRMRKTDKYRLLEGRGRGQGADYVPWLKVHEFGSKGRVHKIYGWKYRREYHLMSDLELYYFLIMQWQENIIDIREQYPLLPLEQTILIADELNIIHPPIRFKDLKDKTVMTSDFLFIVNKGKTMEKLVRTVKTEGDLDSPRTIQKFLIEKTYWDRKGIDWGIVTDKQIPITMAKNIYSIYNNYFWDIHSDYNNEIVENYTYDFNDKLIKYNFDVLKTTNDFDNIKHWEPGESLNFFQYLLTKKILGTDFNVKFNYHTMKVWINS